MDITPLPTAHKRNPLSPRPPRDDDIFTAAAGPDYRCGLRPWSRRTLNGPYESGGPVTFALLMGL